MNELENIQALVNEYLDEQEEQPVVSSVPAVKAKPSKRKSVAVPVQPLPVQSKPEDQPIIKVYPEKKFSVKDSCGWILAAVEAGLILGIILLQTL